MIAIGEFIGSLVVFVVTIMGEAWKALFEKGVSRE